MTYIGKVTFSLDEKAEEIYYITTAQNFVEVAEKLQDDWEQDIIGFTCEELNDENVIYFREENTMKDIKEENSF